MKAPMLVGGIIGIPTLMFRTMRYGSKWSAMTVSDDRRYVYGPFAWLALTIVVFEAIVVVAVMS